MHILIHQRFYGNSIKFVECTECFRPDMTLSSNCNCWKWLF